MIYVFRSPRSTSALKLAQALDGVRVRTQAELWKATAQDAVVYFGSRGKSNAKIALNNAPVYNKLNELRILSEAGVRTVEFSTTNPGEGWLGRTLGHQEGKDLLNAGVRADYWTKKENFVKEFRVHSFRGKSIRAGVKIHREGFQDPHPWVRSYDAGWRISYDGTSIKQKHRDIAHQAVKAMGLDFAAVDLGEREDGTVVVLEINRAPGLEGKTVPIYANAIKTWLKENTL
jgi:hypothetical protein